MNPPIAPGTPEQETESPGLGLWGRHGKLTIADKVGYISYAVIIILGCIAIYKTDVRTSAEQPSSEGVPSAAQKSSPDCPLCRIINGK